MAKSNGHAAEGLSSSSDGASLAGGVWFNNTGTEVIQMQIAQIRAAHDASVQLAQLEARRQLAITALQAEADQAQADFVAAMRSSDYEAVAKAARRMTRAETALVNLGYYEDD
jgi:hypothetical protein